MKRHLSRKHFLSLGVYGGLGLVATRCTLDDTPETTGSAGHGGSTGSTSTSTSTTSTSGSAGSTTSAAGGSGGSSATSTTTGNAGSGGSGGAPTSGAGGGGRGGNGGNGGTGGTGGSGGKGGAGGSAGSGGKGGSGGSGGSKDGGAGDGGGMCSAQITANISGNHAGMPHGLVIPAADIAAGVAKVYATTNVPGMTAQNHTHYVNVTAADFTSLKAGMTVKKHSCSGGDHEYVLKCGGTTDMGAAPTNCANECGGAMSGADGPCP